MGQLEPGVHRRAVARRRHRAGRRGHVQGPQQAGHRPLVAPRNKVVEAEPGKVFAFETQQSGMRWTYRFEPDGDGTLVTEERAAFKARPLVAKVFAVVALGGVDDHEDELRDGMLATLERLKVRRRQGLTRSSWRW